jgi:hypothetical protein
MVFGYHYAVFEGSMRRRSRHTPNTSESTGKIGQELPSNQQAPLVPFYPDDAPAATSPAHPPRSQRPQQPPPAAPTQHAAAQRPPAQSRPPRQDRPAKPEWSEPADSGRFELETQPELPSLPTAEAEAAERSPQAPKGFVVLAIGLPGSGKTTWFRRRGVTPLSSDLLRNILFDDVEEQRYQADCAHALELCGRDQSFHSRTPPVDQDG